MREIEAAWKMSPLLVGTLRSGGTASAFRRRRRRRRHRRHRPPLLRRLAVEVAADGLELDVVGDAGGAQRVDHRTRAEEQLRRQVEAVPSRAGDDVGWRLCCGHRETEEGRSGTRSMASVASGSDSSVAPSPTAAAAAITSASCCGTGLSSRLAPREPRGEVAEVECRIPCAVERVRVEVEDGLARARGGGGDERLGQPGPDHHDVERAR